MEAPPDLRHPATAAAYLAHRSDFDPRLVATLVGLAGGGYLCDSLASVVSNGSAPAAATVTFIGEFLLGVWLVAQGRHLTEAASAS